MKVVLAISVVVLCGMFHGVASRSVVAMSSSTTTPPPTTTTTPPPTSTTAPLPIAPISSSTTSMYTDSSVKPECELFVPLPEHLPCQLDDFESRQSYTLDQKFCMCPSYADCVRREVPDHNKLESTKTIFLCDRDTSSDPEWLDMTHGLLRELQKK